MSRAESKAHTRGALLASARRLFGEKGFNAVSVEEIAGGAGFTRGAFYANFADKADAFWALIEDEDAEMFGDVESQLANEPDVALSVLDRWFERMVTDQPLQQAFDEIRARATSPEDQARLAALFTANRGRIASLLAEQADERGITLGAPVADLAAVFLAIADGLRAQRELDPDAVPLTLIADAFAYVWLGAAAAVEQPAWLSRGSETPTPPRQRPGRRRS